MKWISEADKLPPIGQTVLLASPRQSGGYWDINTAKLLVRHEGVCPRPVNPGERWPTDFYWGRDHWGKDNSLLTGNGWWASLDGIALPPGAEHQTMRGYHCIAQIGEHFVPQMRQAETAQQRGNGAPNGALKPNGASDASANDSQRRDL